MVGLSSSSSSALARVGEPAAPSPTVAVAAHPLSSSPPGQSLLPSQRLWRGRQKPGPATEAQWTSPSASEHVGEGAKAASAAPEDAAPRDSAAAAAGAGEEAAARATARAKARAEEEEGRRRGRGMAAAAVLRLWPSEAEADRGGRSSVLCARQLANRSKAKAR